LDAKFCTELHDIALRILYKLVLRAEKVTTLGPKLAQLSGNFLRAWELLMHTKYTNVARVYFQYFMTIFKIPNTPRFFPACKQTNLFAALGLFPG
jgi:hypothetical protein